MDIINGLLGIGTAFVIIAIMALVVVGFAYHEGQAPKRAGVIVAVAVPLGVVGAFLIGATA